MLRLTSIWAIPWQSWAALRKPPGNLKAALRLKPDFSQARDNLHWVEKLLQQKDGKTRLPSLERLRTELAGLFTFRTRGEPRLSVRGAMFAARLFRV